MGDSLIIKVLFFVYFLCIVSPAWGVTKTVCSSGCDYITIQGALNYASLAGDDIVSITEAKTYTENLTLQTSGASPSSLIYLQNDSGGTVEVYSTSTNVLNINGKSYWYIKGINFKYSGSGTSIDVVSNIGTQISYLTFNNNRVTLDGNNLNGGNVAPITRCDHCTITNNYFEVTGTVVNTPNGPGFAWNTNLLFSGNTVNGNYLMEDGVNSTGTDQIIENNSICCGSTYGGGHPDGFVIQGAADQGQPESARIYIRNNSIFDFDQCIYIDSVWGTFQDVYIYNNLVYGTGHSIGGSSGVNGIIIDGENVGGSNFDIEVYVYNNVIDVNGMAIRLLRTTTGSERKFINNVIVQPGWGQVEISNTSNLTLDYNAFISSGNYPYTILGTVYSFAGAQGLGYEAHGKSVSSLGLNSNYTPQVGSALIDAGLNLNSIFTTDKIGGIRGSTWDIGAYEYGASGGGSIVGVSAPGGVTIK